MTGNRPDPNYIQKERAISAKGQKILGRGGPLFGPVGKLRGRKRLESLVHVREGRHAFAEDHSVGIRGFKRSVFLFREGKGTSSCPETIDKNSLKALFLQSGCEYNFFYGVMGLLMAAGWRKGGRGERPF